MMTYTAYYDASGSQADENEPLVVVGLVQSEARWLAFEREWNEVLRDFNLTHIHMRRMKDRSAELFTSLANVIERAQCLAFSVHVSQADVLAVNQTYKLLDSDRGAGAYSIAAAVCAAKIRAHVTCMEGEDTPILHVFEMGDLGQPIFLKRMEELGTSDSFVLKQKAESGPRQLEAADFCASLYRHQRIYGPGFDSPLDALVDVTTYVSRADLVSMCLAHPDDHPPRGGS